MIQENVSLRPHNTFGVEATARYFVEAKTLSDLESILAWYRVQPGLPLLLLGGGSNLLFTQDWPGLVLKISLLGKSVSGNLVTGAAGENWHEFVLWSLEQGLNGLENLSLIPGQVGTAPIQNIGAYGVEIKDVFESLQALNIKTGEVRAFSNEDCQFDYRDSVFKQAEKGVWIITEVTFKLSTKAQVNINYGTIAKTIEAHGINHPTPKQVSQAVTAIRQAKLPDPKDLGSAGSFFKNPVVSAPVLEKLQNSHPEVPFYPVTAPAGHFKVPAGWLIEQAGWKGHNRGNCGVHANQALVLVNFGGATGLEIKQLAEEIMQSVWQQFGIQLSPEVNVI